MRVVIYDEESLEPITVVELPGLSDMALNERQNWHVGVPMRAGDDPAAKPRFVDLKFERISRVTMTYGEQLAWLCLTSATELAMLLTPEWLPGQRPAIQHLQAENERLSKLIVTSLSRA